MPNQKENIMIKQALFISLFFFSSLVYAQDSDQIIHIDLDSDGKPDTVQLQDNRLHIQLSSQKQPIIEPETELDTLPATLRVVRVGFIETFAFPGGQSSYHFAYDKQSHQIQLIGIDIEYFPNRSLPNYGKGSLNLKTGNYIGKWTILNGKKNTIRTIPIQTNLKITPVILDANFERNSIAASHKMYEIEEAHGIQH